MQAGDRTSIEPGRTRPYDPDLRWRAVYLRIGVGKSIRSIARDLGIDRVSVHRWINLFRTSGDVVRPRNRQGPPPLLDGKRLDLIVATLSVRPTITLGELCDVLREDGCTIVSPPTVCASLRKMCFTNKLVRQRALQQWPTLRGVFMGNAVQFPSEWFVFADETGSTRSTHRRRRGWAVLGQTPVEHRMLSRGRRINTIVAMCADSVLAVESSYEHMNRERFFNFLRGNLLPEMQRFPGPRSILVLDNLSVHHVAEVQQLAAQYGVLILYLPPYSPDLKPSGNAFFLGQGYTENIGRAAADR